MTITYRTTQEALEPGGNLVPVTYILMGTEEFGRLLGPAACGSILFQAKGHYQEPASFQFNSMVQAKRIIEGAIAIGVTNVITNRIREIARDN